MYLTCAERGLTMRRDPLPYETLGREVVTQGELQKLRLRLDVSARFMSELLYVIPTTYHSWEVDPGSGARMWAATANRVGEFWVRAQLELEQVEEAGHRIEDLFPLYAYAMLTATPHEELHKAYREGNLYAVDLGVLGLWVPRSYRSSQPGRKVAA